jgi:Na+/proline symporter
MDSIHRLLQATEPYNVPIKGADGVLYGVLCFTVLLTVGGMALKKGGFSVSDVLMPSDDFLSARGTAGWYAVAASFFSGGMGAWVVYGTPEMGATRLISWWGVIGYSTASAFPALILCWLGPLVKRRVGAESGFTATDFALKRYGRLMHLLVCCISAFYMYIYLVAELTSVANVYATFVGKSIAGTDSESYTTRISVVLVCFTWFYTALAGLPASILTDKFQGVVIFSFVIILLVAATTLKSNEISKDEFDEGTGWFSKGFEAFVTLWIAIAAAELFNQGTWQRVFAAKTDKDLRVGFAVGGCFTTLVLLFFGVMGMIAYSRDRVSYDTYQKLGYLSFFDLLRNLPRAWHYVVLALVTTLGASSIDSLQNGLASVLSSDLLRQKLSPNWSRLVIVGFNIAAVIQAAQRFEVVPLFLCADLVCATSVFPLFLGLWEEDLKIGPVTIPAPTELGAFLGALAGMAAVIVNGEINDVNKAVNPYTGKVYESGNLSYFWGINYKSDGTPYECALCGTKLMVTFIVVPLVSAAATVLFSALDRFSGGDAAKKPFLVVPRLDGDPADRERLMKTVDEKSLELGGMEEKPP